MSERGIDVNNLLSHPQLPFPTGRLRASNGTGALGKFNKGNAHVIDQRDQHFADVFDLRFLRANGLRRRGQLKGADRHAQDTIDEGSNPRPEGILHGLELKFLFSHSAVEETRNNGVFVGPQLRKNFRHVETRLEAGDPRGPKIFRRNGVLLGLLCPKHRFPKALGITRRGCGAKGGQPAFHIHLTGRRRGRSSFTLTTAHPSSLHASAPEGAPGT